MSGGAPGRPGSPAASLTVTSTKIVVAGGFGVGKTYLAAFDVAL